MGDVIELHFSLPPAALRGNGKINARYSKALKDGYSRDMWLEILQTPKALLSDAERLQGPLAAHVVWRQVGEGDVDNCLRGCKPLFDNMGSAPPTKAGADRYYLGVYESDSQIKRICVERERVATKAEEGVQVTICRID